MGIFNQHSNNQPHQSFLRGLRGSPGVGFSLTRDGNYDMNNKKLKNVGEGVESSDAVTKHQLETAINSKINTSPSLNNYVKKDSPEVAADLDMKGYSIKNLKLTSLVVDTGLVRNLSPWLEFSSGLGNVRLNNLINNLRFLLM